MADDKYGRRVHGRLASAGSSKKANRMKKINESKKGISHVDHDYSLPPSDAVSVNSVDNDINVGENVELPSSDMSDVNSTKPWFQGRRVVELDVLANAMHCEKCNAWIRLSDIVDEVVNGLASYLYIKCSSSVCGHITLVPTGKRNGKRGFDVNYKVCLAMVNAGMGPSHVSTFLSGCNLPPINPSTLRKKQKELAPVIIETAETSCQEAREEEKKASEGNEFEASFDAGWQKRGSGWSFSSLTGHASLIGAKTGKIMDFDVRTKSCSVCLHYQGRNEAVPEHDCNINYHGSSKAMEPDMACTMVQRMENSGYPVTTIHADNDATTQSRLPSKMKKKDDKTHVKKNLSKKLYGIAKKHKDLKGANIIAYIVRCFMYVISKHQGQKDHMKQDLTAIIPHIFGDHSKCNQNWCKHHVAPSQFRFKHLPNGQPLSGDKLRNELDQLALSYIDRADKLLDLGSTQRNESFNNSVASFAPKNRFYGGTMIFKARVGGAVAQNNYGYGWLTTVNRNCVLSPGHYTLLHGLRKDAKRRRTRIMQSSRKFKRKRITMKYNKAKNIQREEVKEGDTYGGEIEVQQHVDTETIPSKKTITGKETVIVYDLETTGLLRTSEITQLAAFDGKEAFNQYASPSGDISPKASEITGLVYDQTHNQMYHNGVPVNNRNIRLVLLEFIDFLKGKEKPILVGHNIAAYDNHILINQLRQYDLLAEFMRHVYGCIDTYKMAKKKFEKKEIGNYKQQTLVSRLLGIEYDAHDAFADVTSLYQLLEHFTYSDKDIFPFDVMLLVKSFDKMVKASYITSTTARKLACSGLCQKHLQLAFNRGGESGLRSVLLEHGIKLRRISTSISKYFREREE